MWQGASSTFGTDFILCRALHGDVVFGHVPNNFRGLLLVACTMFRAEVALCQKILRAVVVYRFRRPILEGLVTDDHGTIFIDNRSNFWAATGPDFDVMNTSAGA